MSSLNAKNPTAPDQLESTVVVPMFVVMVRPSFMSLAGLEAVIKRPAISTMAEGLRRRPDGTRMWSAPAYTGAVAGVWGGGGGAAEQLGSPTDRADRTPPRMSMSARPAGPRV